MVKGQYFTADGTGLTEIEAFTDADRNVTAKITRAGLSPVGKSSVVSRVVRKGTWTVKVRKASR